MCPIAPRCSAKAGRSPAWAAPSALVTAVVHQPSRAASSSEAEIAVVAASCGVSAARSWASARHADCQRRASAMPESTSSPEGVSPGPRPISAATRSARASSPRPQPDAAPRLQLSAVATMSSALASASAIPGCSTARTAPGSSALPRCSVECSSGCHRPMPRPGTPLMRCGRHMRLMCSWAAGSSSRSGWAATRSPVLTPAVRTSAGTCARMAVGRS